MGEEENGLVEITSKSKMSVRRGQKEEERFNPQMKLARHGEFYDFLEGKKIYPINIEVSPCHTCNATCPWCFYAGTHGKLKSSTLDKSVGIQLIEDLAYVGTKAITWTGGGEPSLHPDFPEFTRHAHESGLEQGLFTNGLLMPRYDPSLFKWIRVSNTDKSWNEGVLSKLRETSKVLGMALNYVGNDEEVMEALSIGEKVGVDYVQVRQALELRGLVTEREPPKIDHPLLMVTLYKFGDSSNPHGYEKCFGFNFVPFVWHDGNVDVCGYHRGKGGELTLGNLHSQRFKEIIDNAPEYVKVRSDCQVCCKNHEINKLVNQAKDLKDVNFV
jgi:MoaA/NifB/PqqE/SkfB family radical SAM enzyme